MTDFRVEIPTGEDSEVARELDWDEKDGRWTASERELGSNTWMQGILPVPADMDALRLFFLLGDQVDAASLVTVAPERLVARHREAASGSPRLLARRCTSCGEHWLVDRRGDDGQWRRYGRTCTFRWFRGVLVDPSLEKSE